MEESSFVREQIIRKSNGSIVAPDNIIKTRNAAFQEYTSLRSEHLDRILEYAAIDGQIAGNPPYDQGELDSNGLGHLTNYNNYKSRSGYEKSAQMYWNLINSVEHFVKISCGLKIPKAQEYADTIAIHFSDICKEWESFHTNFNLLGSQLTKIGLCPVIFPDERSFIWEAVEASKFFIPSQAQTDISKLTTCCVKTSYTVQALYGIYTKLEKQDDWNKDALSDFLIRRANSFLPNESTPITSTSEFQRYISNNDVTVNKYFNDTVWLVHHYKKEYDGKITHSIFSDELTAEDDFLYFVDRQYDSMEDAVVIFTASSGEWTIHSSVGLGQKMYPGNQAVNMLECSIVDTAIMAGTTLIRTIATGGRDVGPIRWIPGVPIDIGGAELVENKIGANINQMVGASQFVDRGLQENAINAGDDPSTPDRAQGSLAPVAERSRSYREFNTPKNLVAHFYNTFDKIVRRMFIRMLHMKSTDTGWEYAKEFKRRCIEDGVPEFFFDTVKTGIKGLPLQYRAVRATRVAGDGSTLARLMALDELADIKGTFNEGEISSYKREKVLVALGADYISTFASSDGQSDETSGGHSLAVLENNFMQMGKSAGFSPDNDQGAHAVTHMALLAETTKTAQNNQMSPVDADKIFGLALPHMTEHLQFMSKSPELYQEVLSNLESPFKQIMQYAQLVRRNAEAMVKAAQDKQAQDQAATQAVMGEEERKNMAAQGDERRAEEKHQHQLAENQKSNETRGEIMKEKVVTDAEIKRLKVEKEAEIKQNATARGRSQGELLAKSPDELSAQLSDMNGKTPSSVDFEPTY